MARRGSFLSALDAIAREVERQAREQEREQRRIEREYARAEKEQIRAEKRAAKERAAYEKECAITRVLKELEKAEKILTEQNTTIENLLQISKDKKYSYSFDELYSNEEFNIPKPELKISKPKPSPVKNTKYDILFGDYENKSLLSLHTVKNKGDKILNFINNIQPKIKKADIILSLLLPVLIFVPATIETIFNNKWADYPIVLITVGFLFWFSFSPVVYFGYKKFNYVLDKAAIVSYYIRLFFVIMTQLVSIAILFTGTIAGSLIAITISTIAVLAFAFDKVENFVKEETEYELTKIKKQREDYYSLKENFIKDCQKWVIEALKLKIKNEEVKNTHKQDCIEWEILKNEFYENQNKLNQNIDGYKEQFKAHKKDAVELYFQNIINQIEQPVEYEWKYELFYNEANKLLEISYNLPIYDDFPTLSGLSYIKTKNEIKETHFSESANKKRYEEYIYKLIFSIIAIVFNSDEENAIQTIVFNGQAENIDRTIGKKIKNCVLSLMLEKEQFSEMNLEYIDPKVTFKANKGIAGTHIADLVPVAPIITYDKNDSRFIEAYDVLHNVNVGTNLAVIDWRDFENLIRDIFEKEFSQNGSEVRITQSSRDGGVDVIAFDPDPIRGGKIVIQAKRYTNVVGVSAVRDLYGTLINEGASKGILITTSDYGSDAHNFAKGKPLTLLNGNHLLHLIKKHGQEAYIDLQEAKSILYGE